MVKNLNAQFTGGLSADMLQATGGDGFTRPATDTPIDTNGEIVAATGPLPGGTYYVTATALLFVAPGDADGLCTIVRGSAPTQVINLGGANREGDIQAAETTAVAITAGDTLGERCIAGGFHGSDAYNAGIIAIRILTSHGTPPARSGTLARAAR